MVLRVMFRGRNLGKLGNDCFFCVFVCYGYYGDAENICNQNAWRLYILGLGWFQRYCRFMIWFAVGSPLNATVRAMYGKLPTVGCRVLVSGSGIGMPCSTPTSPPRSVSWAGLLRITSAKWQVLGRWCMRGPSEYSPVTSPPCRSHRIRDGCCLRSPRGRYRLDQYRRGNGCVQAPWHWRNRRLYLDRNLRPF